MGFPTMPYSVTVHEGEGIACVNVSGMLPYSEQVTVVYEAMRIIQNKGHFGILVNLADLDTALNSAADCCALGKHIADVKPPMHIALVVPVDPKSKADVHYTMLVAENRGSLIRQFDDAEAAKKWLLDQGKAKTS
jgi:hypothetical protein